MTSEELRRLIKHGETSLLGSGIPRVLSEDSDVQFVDDKAGNQFKAIIKRPVVNSEQVAQEVGQKIRQVSDQVKSLILCLFGNELPKSELLKLGKLTKSRETLEQNFINPAIDDGYIAMLYPNNPHHPKQKYYLTEKGKTLYLQLTALSHDKLC